MSQATAEELPRVPRREPAAEQQIADARAEPTDVEIEAQMQDAQLRYAQLKHEAVSAFAGIDPTPPDTLTLSGARLTAYRQLELAAAAAHRAQNDMVSTGAQLREAIQALCAAIAPGAK